jgi:hypothetical protein
MCSVIGPACWGNDRSPSVRKVARSSTHHPGWPSAMLTPARFTGVLQGESRSLELLFCRIPEQIVAAHINPGLPAGVDAYA